MSSIKDLSECLFILEDNPNRCVIRGELLDGIDENQKVLRRKKATDDHPAYFGEKAEGHQWVCFDFDKVPAPLGLTSNDERLAYLASLLGNEFEDVSFHYQWSSSAGLYGWDTLSCHLWYWLGEPRTDSEMCRWAKDNGNVDDAIFRTVQPHYTARPKFIDMDDPIGPDRSGFVKRKKDNVLVPKVSEPRTKHSGGSSKQDATTLLANHWRNGRRQDIALAVSGSLLRSGWSVPDTEDFIEAICIAAHDDEVDKRIQTVLYTKDTIQSGNPFTGLTKLGELIGEDVVRRVAKWLKLKKDEDNKETYLRLMNTPFVNEKPVWSVLGEFDLSAGKQPVYDFLKEAHKMSRVEATKAITTFQKNNNIRNHIGEVPKTASEFIEIMIASIGLSSNLKGELNKNKIPNELYEAQKKNPNDPMLNYQLRSHLGSIRRDEIFRELILMNDDLSLGYRENVLDAALGKWIKLQKEEEKAKLISDVCYDPSQEKLGGEELDRLVTLFVDPIRSDQKYIKAVLKHFIWQTKRKLLGLSVNEHMMPVFSGKQGGGKSRLVELFISPMEQVSRNVDFKQIADDRNIDIWDETYIMFVDEMSHSKKADIETIKSVITASNLQRRPMRTNAVSQVKQNATFIGTANESLAKLIYDETGIRRFFPIYCLAMWDYLVVNSIDYAAIWKSVDENIDTEITSILPEIRDIQETERNMGAVETWLSVIAQTDIELDEWISAQEAYDNFVRWTEHNWSSRGNQFRSITSFGRELSNRIDGEYVQKRKGQKSSEYRFCP